MKAVVFTSNQPRHLALLRELAAVCDEVFAVLECTTVFPGQRSGVFNSSVVMEEYFSKMLASEKYFFGTIDILPENVRCISIAMGDASFLKNEQLTEVLDGDIFIVFGCSYLKGDVVDLLISKRAINIHMGISPYYRGSSCNFWALYDQRPELVGATLHFLSRGLDSGDIISHIFPASQPNPSLFSMSAVKSAHLLLREYATKKKIDNLSAIKQDIRQELRYSTGKEFTDSIAAEFLSRTSSIPDDKQLIELRAEFELRSPIVENE